jgi:hypothetical protein
MEVFLIRISTVRRERRRAVAIAHLVRRTRWVGGINICETNEQRPVFI